VSADKLGENLWSWPTLVSTTSLEHPWNWQAMVRLEDGKMVSKGYGQVCLFTCYLVDRFGMDKVQEYESRMHWTTSPKKNFKRVFETSLDFAEAQWLLGMMESKEAPPETSFIPLPFDFLIFLRWLFIVVIILIPIFLIIRWINWIISWRR